MAPATRSTSDRALGDLGRAVLSWAAFVLGLGLAGVAAEWARAAGTDGDLLRAVPAVVVLVVTVPLVLAVHGRARWSSVLAVRRPALVALGAVVALAAAAAVLVVDHLAGGVRVTGVDGWLLARWLLTTLLLAAALEAVPEELALRGGVYGALRGRVPGWVAGAVTTASFVVAPAAAIWLSAELGRLWGVGGVAPATFAPGGQDPVEYAVLLAVFGVVLLLVRAVTGSVWACVGFHLAFLVVNRLLLGDAATTGVTVASGKGLGLGREPLVLLYLVLAAVVLVVVLRRRRR